MVVPFEISFTPRFSEVMHDAKTDVSGFNRFKWKPLKTVKKSRRARIHLAEAR